MVNRGMIEWEDCINMTMCIILVVAAARLTPTDTQFLRNLLAEILAGLLTTIFFLQAYT
jgi:hypothetical protein